MKEKIILRAITMKDIEMTLKWHNSEEIKKMYSGHPFPVNIEMEQKWYDKILTSNYPITVFGIEIVEKSELIGITSLKNIDLLNRNAEFAIYLGENKYKRKGYAKEATLLTLKFAFYDLGLKRVFLKVIENNLTAIRLYESCGFKLEGSLRNSIFKKGLFKNELVYSILYEEYNV